MYTNEMNEVMEVSNLLDYMNDLNITNHHDLEKYINENDIDVLVSFLEHTRELALSDWDIGEYSPYAFVPSLELSGFGGCHEIQCKLQRAQNFAKYAALYCDKVYLYVPLITIPHKLDYDAFSIKEFKEDMLAEFALIIIYSPLIERKIVKIVPPNFSICKNCFEELFFNKSELDSVISIAAELSKKVQVFGVSFFKQLNTGLLRIKNLEEFFPHRYLEIVSGPFVQELEKMDRYPSLIKNEKLIADFIKSILVEEYYNTKFEAFMSSAYKSKYITAKVSSKTIIETIDGKTPMHHEPALPIYDMPIIDTVKTERILEARDQEQEAFNQYRDALTFAMKEHYKGQSEIEITEVYDDIVYPAFVKLESALKRIKQQSKRKAVGSLIIAGSTVTLGILGGIIPPNPMGIIAGLGSATLLANIGKMAIEQTGPRDEARVNDFYFLWKLKNKGITTTSHNTRTISVDRII
jgi:hypothetical protein